MYNELCHIFRSINSNHGRMDDLSIARLLSSISPDNFVIYHIQPILNVWQVVYDEFEILEKNVHRAEQALNSGQHYGQVTYLSVFYWHAVTFRLHPNTDIRTIGINWFVPAVSSELSSADSYRSVGLPHNEHKKSVWLLRAPVIVWLGQH